MKDEQLFQKAWVIDGNSKVFPSALYPYDVRNKPTAIDFASRRAIEEEKELDESQVTIFFKTTSITALNQVQYTDSYLLKFYWIILFVSGFSVSIFQSYLVIDNFLKFDILDRTRITLQSTVEFPAITVCANIPLKWNNETYISDPQMKEFVDELNKHHGMTSDNRYQKIIDHLAGLDRNTRMELGVQKKDFIVHCTARELDDIYRSCSHDLLMSNSLYYGNCFTFNSGIKGDNSWLLTSDLNLGLNFFTTTEYKDPRREASLMVVAHQAGTAPPLREALYMSPGDFLEVDLFKKEYHRLPWPYKSECYENGQLRYQMLSLYYDEDHPYLYSPEACIESCIQNITMDSCQCFISQYVLRKVKRPVKECEQSCGATPSSDISRICQCKNPCDQFEYSTKVHRHPEKYYQIGFMSSFLEEELTEEKFEMIKENGAVGLTISLRSQFVEMNEESAEEQALNMLGNIGGVFGLWIGISIMSIFEIFVSFYDGLLKCLCGKTRKRKQ
ncbi:hypothetical protein CHUAL_001493 [Chamberlinius hualienensis]